MAAINTLSDKAVKAAIKAASTAGKARKLSDGGGLVLEARPNGVGWWRLRYWLSGKEGMVSLGIYPDVPLALARERREPLLALRLSPLAASSGYQLRQSPVGFRSEFHCTVHPQWLFVLSGCMEIGLQDGSTWQFGPGSHFYSADTLPEGAVFDPKLHGHWSRQVGDEALVTLFVRA